MSDFHASPSDGAGSGALFKDLNKIRRGGEPTPNRDEAEAKEHAKLNNSCCATLVKNKKFEVLTLSVIVFNALFIGYDADYSARYTKPDNLYDKEKWGFPLMENLFAVYFTFEVVVRFFAFKGWFNLIDAWFIFDSTLVLMMVVETYVLAFVASGGGMKQLSILRLLRLLRITRMGKLMRFFPQLQIIIKGMVAAVRSVFCTAVLLVLVLYVFSIIFTSIWHQGDVTDKEAADKCEEEGDPLSCAQNLFGSLPKSMRHLFIMGTILDDITACTNTIRMTKESYMLYVFIIFVLMSSFTMLNMLIGILCEVVQATAEGERFKNSAASIREAIGSLFRAMDQDGNGQISRDEFLQMKKDKDVLAALHEVDVKPKHFDMYADLMFKEKEGSAEPETLSLDTTIDLIMRLRPGAKISALDFASFQQTIYKNHNSIKNSIHRIDKLMALLGNKESNNDAGANQPEEEPASSISLEALEKVPDQDIIAELQSRIGTNVNLPASLDPGKVAEIFEALSGEGFQRDSFSC
jgi:voltage-gated sodium channel